MVSGQKPVDLDRGVQLSAAVQEFLAGSRAARRTSSRTRKKIGSAPPSRPGTPSPPRQRGEAPSDSETEGGGGGGGVRKLRPSNLQRSRQNSDTEAPDDEQPAVKTKKKKRVSRSSSRSRARSPEDSQDESPKRRGGREEEGKRRVKKKTSRRASRSRSRANSGSPSPERAVKKSSRVASPDGRKTSRKSSPKKAAKKASSRARSPTRSPSRSPTRSPSRSRMSRHGKLDRDDSLRRSRSVSRSEVRDSVLGPRSSSVPRELEGGGGGDGRRRKKKDRDERDRGREEERGEGGEKIRRSSLSRQQDERAYSPSRSLSQMQRDEEEDDDKRRRARRGGGGERASSVSRTRSLSRSRQSSLSPPPARARSVTTSRRQRSPSRTQSVHRDRSRSMSRNESLSRNPHSRSRSPLRKKGQRTSSRSPSPPFNKGKPARRAFSVSPHSSSRQKRGGAQRERRKGSGGSGGGGGGGGDGGGRKRSGSPQRFGGKKKSKSPPSPNLRKKPPPKLSIEDVMPPSRKILIENLTQGTSRKELKHTFKKFGSITEMDIQPGGYAYVTFREVDSARAAIIDMNAKKFQGVRINVTPATDDEDDGPSFQPPDEVEENTTSFCCAKQGPLPCLPKCMQQIIYAPVQAKSWRIIFYLVLSFLPLGLLGFLAVAITLLPGIVTFSLLGLGLLFLAPLWYSLRFFAAFDCVLANYFLGAQLEPILQPAPSSAATCSSRIVHGCNRASWRTALYFGLLKPFVSVLSFAVLVGGFGASLVGLFLWAIEIKLDIAKTPLGTNFTGLGNTLFIQFLKTAGGQFLAGAVGFFGIFVQFQIIRALAAVGLSLTRVIGQQKVVDEKSVGLLMSESVSFQDKAALDAMLPKRRKKRDY